jgi:hypothetical protein
VLLPHLAGVEVEQIEQVADYLKILARTGPGPAGRHVR